MYSPDIFKLINCYHVPYFGTSKITTPMSQPKNIFEKWWSSVRSFFTPGPRPEGVLSEDAAKILSDPAKAEALAKAMYKYRRGGSGIIEVANKEGSETPSRKSLVAG